ncbi:two-component histidine kinase MprB [Nocardia asteroides NBRC 15531]|uniref:Signal transduction histidine-protein kinase/phosphatase MprB n=1 Tax=Nocardia asteroides NBRC 15531 TaxID=1110697 RepID=U5EAL1_NOCAS|nr:two-component histidine kinase MprB [Nocardia asteroides NBRC 15531]SFL75018.1 two-component system, OmpR family, sensor histidine kinase MprB [Nocardia asteroides]VEG31301.1 Signal transduction histidine-protein kinase/phosphatase mprB [Nocardia asteroides]
MISDTWHGAPVPGSAGSADPSERRKNRGLSSSLSLRWRVALLAATVVAIGVALASIAAYVLVARSLYSDVDNQLRTRAAVMIDNNVDNMNYFEVLTLGSLYSDSIGAVLIFPDSRTGIHAVGHASSPPIGAPELAVARGEVDSSLRTVSGHRMYSQRMSSGATLVLWQRLRPTEEVLDRLAWLLLVVGGCGVLLAAAAGTAVGRTGLRPVARLNAATARVARTDDLAPIPVTGDDELARLATSFNTMLRAIAESRERQRRLVADAGHELKTPLTSLRTNMELLIASSRPGAPPVPDQDMADLRDDVVAQLQELSTLVGDLVDLAREDAPEAVFERIDLTAVVERALDRVRRRRSGIEFAAELRPWLVYGHDASLERAIVNILDNAAKWSPPDAPVHVEMRESAPGLLELTVDDAGPGIPPAERELVFDRFYRTTAARSMPGSGLGLAIVRRVVIKHGGTIDIENSHRQGTLIRIVLPGENATAANN